MEDAITVLFQALLALAIVVAIFIACRVLVLWYFKLDKISNNIKTQTIILSRIAKQQGVDVSDIKVW